MIKRLLLVAAVVSGLQGCGGGGGSAKAQNAELTPQEKILQLEDKGLIPKLERGDTLSGLDGNSNGVRDDIDAYIQRSFQKAEQQAAATQTAKALQRSLVIDVADPLAVKSVDIELARGIHCIYSKFKNSPGEKTAARVVGELEAITTNTKARLRAYLGFSKALDGTVTAQPRGESCE